MGKKQEHLRVLGRKDNNGSLYLARVSVSEKLNTRTNLLPETPLTLMDTAVAAAAAPAEAKDQSSGKH